MRKPWQVILGFALFGLAITAVSYVYYDFIDYTKPMKGITSWLVTIFVVLCPPSLLSVLCIDCEVGTGSGVFMFSIIGLLNSVLYAVLGAVYLAFRKETRPSVD